MRDVHRHRPRVDDTFQQRRKAVAIVCLLTVSVFGLGILATRQYLEFEIARIEPDRWTAILATETLTLAWFAWFFWRHVFGARQTDPGPQNATTLSQL